MLYFYVFLSLLWILIFQNSLQPDDKFQVVPDSIFVVSRTARKDGSSDYYVDNKKMTFREVGTLLRKSGIDLDHNRFLILQVCLSLTIFLYLIYLKIYKRALYYTVEPRNLELGYLE